MASKILDKNLSNIKNLSDTDSALLYISDDDELYNNTESLSDDDLILDDNLLENPKKITFKVKLDTKKVEKIKKNKNNNKVPTEIKSELKLSDQIDNILKTIENQMNELKNTKMEIIKIKKTYDSDINNLWKQKRKKQTIQIGFINKKEIPINLANLLEIDKNKKLSLPEITKLFINNVLRKRNLIYEQDKRVYRIDEDIHQLLNISYDVNNSINYLDKEGFNFNTLQRILNNYLKNNNQKILSNNI
jgi:uncharacterized protein YbaR (Trm112 family)